MDVSHEDKKRRLKAKNAQTIFFRKLREQSLQLPETKYTFLEPNRAERILQELINKNRGGPEVEYASLDEAISRAKHWLSEHDGLILCVVPEVGILGGDSSYYLVDFPVFAALFDPFLQLSTMDLSAAFSWLRSEYGYRGLAWTTTRNVQAFHSE
jgi:hypothetical protein